MFGFKNILNIFVFEETEDNYRWSFNSVLKNMDSSTSTLRQVKMDVTLFLFPCFYPLEYQIFR